MRFRSLLAVPFVALALVGCSSSDGGSGSGSDGTVPAGATLITAIEGIAWDSPTYTGTAVDGRVTISVKNDSSLPHNLHLIDSDNVDVGVSLEVSGRGQVDTESVALKPGTYKVICTITGHGNMKSTLTVS